MIFTKIYIHNIYSFADATLDLSYPKRLKDSTIEDEFLVGRPKFYVKRVCILSGANASGKTSLGKILNRFQCFINFKIPFIGFKENIYDKTKDAILECEFATPKSHRLHHLKIIFNYKNSNFDFEYASVFIGVNDSVTQTRTKLEAAKKDKGKVRNTRYFSSFQDKFPISLTDMFDELENQFDIGWFYLYSTNQESQNNNLNRDWFDARVLKIILQAFDHSVIDVLESKDDDGPNGFKVKFGNGDNILIDLDGETADKDRFSKGTYDAISVANFISRVIANRNYETKSAIFYLDEKMAFSHSELERAIVNLIIDKLDFKSQFFYTTHNFDILDLNLPVHSFVFLKKNNECTQFVQPELSFNKNDRKLLNYIRNNVFGTLPDTSGIDSLLWE